MLCLHCIDKLERLSLTWISTFYCEVYYRIDPRIGKRKGRKEIERSSLNEYVWDTKRGKIRAKKQKKSQRMKANNHNREMPRCKPSMGSRSPMNEKTVAYKS